jgi:CHAD domain-containing protein
MAKKRMDWDEAASASANSRVRLPAMAQSYFEQGRKLLDPSSAPSAMHRFRLETKAFRYSLEFFRPCYGPALERYLEGLREIQDCLGAFNDCAATRDLIAEKLPKHDPEREKIEGFLAQRGRRESANFRRYWRTTFDGPGQEQRWLHYLSRRIGFNPRMLRPPHSSD